LVYYEETLEDLKDKYESFFPRSVRPRAVIWLYEGELLKMGLTYNDLKKILRKAIKVQESWESNIV